MPHTCHRELHLQYIHKRHSLKESFKRGWKRAYIQTIFAPQRRERVLTSSHRDAESSHCCRCHCWVCLWFAALYEQEPASHMHTHSHTHMHTMHVATSCQKRQGAFLLNFSNISQWLHTPTWACWFWYTKLWASGHCTVNSQNWCTHKV